MIVRFLAPDRREFREAVNYYEQQRTGLGKDCSKEVQATLKRIEAFPSSGSLLGQRIRRCPTKQFPYGIIYATENDEILIIAVAHLHRKPDYWRNRI